MSIEELEAEIRKLSLTDRGVLPRRIVESLDELSDVELEALWAEEAERRLDELERGAAIEISAHDVLSRARAALP